VEPCRFRVLREDDVHGWLGASPDGLIASLTTQGLTRAQNAYSSASERGRNSRFPKLVAIGGSSRGAQSALPTPSLPLPISCSHATNMQLQLSTSRSCFRQQRALSTVARQRRCVALCACGIRTVVSRKQLSYRSRYGARRRGRRSRRAGGQVPIQPGAAGRRPPAARLPVVLHAAGGQLRYNCAQPAQPPLFCATHGLAHDADSPDSICEGQQP